VNPFYVVARHRLIEGPAADIEQETREWLPRLMAPLHRSDTLDVVLKRENTHRFLQEAMHYLLANYRPWAERKHEKLARDGAVDA
jgi:hypothetical protein